MVVLHATENYVVRSYCDGTAYGFFKHQSSTSLQNCPHLIFEGDDAHGFCEDLSMIFQTQPTLSLNDQLDALWHHSGYGDSVFLIQR